MKAPPMRKLITLAVLCPFILLMAAKPEPPDPGEDCYVQPSYNTATRHGDDDLEKGKSLYMKSCAACHGADGTGTSQSLLGFDTPPPDFTDCNFATREPDADWIAVAHQGGPVRGFAREMPAFGEALSQEELQLIMGFIRTLCDDDRYPRGELNLPRAIVTEKAFPEDEAVLTTTFDVENEGAVINELLFERRLGARGQLEIAVPFGFRETEDGWTGGQLGDVAVGLKQVVFQNMNSGSILSLGGEVLLPTGNKNNGIGSGITTLEPFMSFGQGLPADAFIQIQTGLEFPLLRDNTTDEFFLRGVLGKTFVQNTWGRAWSPMVEVLANQPLVSGAETEWALFPQMQVSLNTRQHVMLNAGVQIPLDDSSRDMQFAVYLLWEWFDGGLFEGW